MENPAPLTCALPERVATVGEGVKDSLPIVISYLPVAFAFGLNATRLGFTPLESLFFSCIIYAGCQPVCDHRHVGHAAVRCGSPP